MFVGSSLIRGEDDPLYPAPVPLSFLTAAIFYCLIMLSDLRGEREILAARKCRSESGWCDETGRIRAFLWVCFRGIFYSEKSDATVTSRIVFLIDGNPLLSICLYKSGEQLICEIYISTQC